MTRLSYRVSLHVMCDDVHFNARGTRHVLQFRSCSLEAFWVCGGVVEWIQSGINRIETWVCGVWWGSGMDSEWDKLY